MGWLCTLALLILLVLGESARICHEPLAWPFHALFARISYNTFFESLKHTDQPWVGFISGTHNLLKTASAYFTG